MLTGATYLAPHYGPFNAKLRGHLPLVVPADPAPVLVVAGQNVTWTEGRTIVFDDTYEHEVRDLSSKSFAIRKIFLQTHTSYFLKFPHFKSCIFTTNYLRAWLKLLKVPF